MWYLYLIIIVLAVLCCCLFMNLVRVVPEAIQTGKKLGKKTYLRVLALVALVVLIAGLLGRYRCHDCGILGATMELNGERYCETCYENETW